MILLILLFASLSVNDAIPMAIAMGSPLMVLDLILLSALIYVVYKDSEQPKSIPEVANKVISMTHSLETNKAPMKPYKHRIHKTPNAKVYK